MVDKKIIQMHDAKMKRYDKTSESILVSWAINNAVNSLPEGIKNLSEWDNYKEFIRIRYPFFIELYKEYFAGKPLSDWDIENGQEKYDTLSEEMEIKTSLKKEENKLK